MYKHECLLTLHNVLKFRLATPSRTLRCKRELRTLRAMKMAHDRLRYTNGQLDLVDIFGCFVHLTRN